MVVYLSPKLNVWKKDKSLSSHSLNTGPVPRVTVPKLLQANHFWLPHIKNDGAKCLRLLSILRYLTHPKIDCNCVHVVFTPPIIHSLNYRAPIYGLAFPWLLAILDLIQNSAIRIFTSTFRASFSMSLCADADISPLLTPITHGRVSCCHPPTSWHLYLRPPLHFNYQSLHLPLSQAISTPDPLPICPSSAHSNSAVSS